MKFRDPGSCCGDAAGFLRGRKRRVFPTTATKKNALAFEENEKRFCDPCCGCCGDVADRDDYFVVRQSRRRRNTLLRGRKRRPFLTTATKKVALVVVVFEEHEKKFRHDDDDARTIVGVRHRRWNHRRTMTTSHRENFGDDGRW
jgi:hypothetical protein